MSLSMSDSIKGQHTPGQWSQQAQGAHRKKDVPCRTRTHVRKQASTYLQTHSELTMTVLKSDPEQAYTEHDVPGAADAASEPSQYSIYDYDEVPENKSWASTIPIQKGLYNPEYEKDNCGVGTYLLNFLPDNTLMPCTPPSILNGILTITITNISLFSLLQVSLVKSRVKLRIKSSLMPNTYYVI
jgi:hypothetical protein